MNSPVLKQQHKQWKQTVVFPDSVESRMNFGHKEHKHKPTNRRKNMLLLLCQRKFKDIIK
jgi:hypothetical protein